jgi:NAD(P)H-dependent flavin oxidoreductase YrpB (nitropropane dioxygenase family)
VQERTPVLELVSEMRTVLELPIVAAGGIADVASARAALEAGANAVACGTAFLVAYEADVHPTYLDRLLHAAATDTVLTTVFDVGWPDAPHRVLRNGTYTTWESAGRPTRGARHGEGEVVGTRNGSSIVRYSDAQPTSGTTGEIDAMALYAGTSVAHVRAARERQRDHRGDRSSSHVVPRRQETSRTLAHATLARSLRETAWSGP